MIGALLHLSAVGWLAIVVGSLGGWLAFVAGGLYLRPTAGHALRSTGLLLFAAGLFVIGAATGIGA